VKARDYLLKKFIPSPGFYLPSNLSVVRYEHDRTLKEIPISAAVQPPLMLNACMSRVQNSGTKTHHITTNLYDHREGRVAGAPEYAVNGYAKRVKHLIDRREAKRYRAECPQPRGSS